MSPVVANLKPQQQEKVADIGQSVGSNQSLRESVNINLKGTRSIGGMIEDEFQSLLNE